MKSLSQLLSEAPVLILDATSSKVQVGLYKNKTSLGQYAYSTEESGIGLFKAVESLSCNLTEVKTFIYANTPGSVLGVRTVAMALRIWKTLGSSQVYSYNALALLAEATKQPDITYIADARRETWHAYKLDSLASRTATPDLISPLVMPEGFRTWSTLPKDLKIVPYNIEQLWPLAMSTALLSPSENPDAFLYEQPSYVTWDPQIHRKPLNV